MEETQKPVILIVDDITQNIQVVANILKEEGFEISFALNGTDALNYVKNESFDLILLDIMMPGLSGFDVCKELKSDAKTKDIPVIFLTAKTDIESVTRGFETGGVDYITKPFNATELIARVNTHIKLKFQQQKLKELNATKDKFFSIIAHDLRNPLGAMLGLCDQIAKHIKSNEYEKLGEFSELMCESLDQTYNLMENLLDWSRIQTKRVQFSPEILDIGVLVKNTVSLLKGVALYKNISIIKELEDNVNATADENMIRTILRNLITNAIKFTPDNGKITIKVEKSGRKTFISVIDTGIGISEENIDKIFDLDVSHTTVGTNQEKGTGLGLILCKEFVERNGGILSVESTLGAGSTFKFFLPSA